MLKGISSLLSPQLLEILASMGHGDELVLGDRNYPAASTSKRCVRADGISATDLLEAILQIFPLDKTGGKPSVFLMAPAPGDGMQGDPPVWQQFEKSVERYEPQALCAPVERFAFYEQAKAAYAAVQTGETAAYGCLILKKGVVPLAK